MQHNRLKTLPNEGSMLSRLKLFRAPIPKQYKDKNDKETQVFLSWFTSQLGYLQSIHQDDFSF